MGEMTLEDLLEWQKMCGENEEHQIFVELYTDGSAECQVGKDFEKKFDGSTLKEALIKAYEDWQARIPIPS